MIRTVRSPARGGRLLLAALVLALLGPVLVLGAATAYGASATAGKGGGPATRPATRPQTRAAVRTLGYAQVEGYWVAAGGPGTLAGVAAAIAAAESGLEPGAIQSAAPYAHTGWGLWQITPGNSAPSVYGSDYQLLDPWNNAEAAVWKYDEQGLSAWSTYSDGGYKSYLQNVAPDLTVTDPGEYPQTGPAPPDTPATPAAQPGSTFGPAMPALVSSSVYRGSSGRRDPAGRLPLRPSLSPCGGPAGA